MGKIKQIGHFFNKPLVAILLSFFIFAPLLFINIRSDHDWGGDFSQYLSQADNIAHFKPMEKTGYVFNEDYSTLGPTAYPPVFPLLIAPLNKIYGDYIPPYNYFLSFLLVITAILSVFFLKKKYGLIPALALNIVIFFNPYFVGLKSEIIADIPFALLFIGFILLTFQNNPHSIKKWILAGIFTGLATSTKTIGNTLFIALLLYSFQLTIYTWIKSKNHKNILKSAKGPLLALAVGFSLCSLINLLFLGNIFGSSGYGNSFDLNGLSYKMMTENVYYYSEILRTFFIELSSSELWFGALFGSAILTFFITGLIISIANKPGLNEWIILVYFGLLLIYPYQHSGFRFLIPIAPLILYYSAQTVLSLKPGKGGVYLSLIIAGMMLTEYYPRLLIIHESSKNIQEGPYSAHVKNAFAEITKLTNNQDLIAFNKPRVLYHFTKRRSMSHKPGSSVAQMDIQFMNNKPNFYLLYTGLMDPSLEQYIIANQSNIELIWQDDFFKFYKRKGSV